MLCRSIITITVSNLGPLTTVQLYKKLMRYNFTDNEIKDDDRTSIQTLHSTRWAMAHSFLHDVGFLLNPLNLVHEPWAVASVMEGFRELIKLWNDFIARDGDSIDMTIAKATNELETYIDVAKNSAKTFVSKIMRPDTIAGTYLMLSAWPSDGLLFYLI